MSDTQPRLPGDEPRASGDRTTDRPAGGGRRLDAPPSARYADPRAAVAPATRSGLPGPLFRAAVAGAAGAALLVLVGAILASTFGLLFVAAGLGGAVGLSLSRAAVPPDDARTTPRRTVVLLAVAIALVAVVVADVVTWQIARAEGGTLGLVDYLLTTFGPFVPAVAVLAALAAWWGASAGPVQS